MSSGGCQVPWLGGGGGPPESQPGEGRRHRVIGRASTPTGSGVSGSGGTVVRPLYWTCKPVDVRPRSHQPIVHVVREDVGRFEFREVVVVQLYVDGSTVGVGWFPVYPSRDQVDEIVYRHWPTSLLENGDDRSATTVGEQVETSRFGEFVCHRWNLASIITREKQVIYRWNRPRRFTRLRIVHL